MVKWIMMMSTAADAADGVGFPYSKLITRTLYLQVFDYDRFSRDDPIGEVCLPLAEVDLSNVQTMWKTLQPCKGHVVSLSHSTSGLSLSLSRVARGRHTITSARFTFII